MSSHPDERIDADVLLVVVDDASREALTRHLAELGWRVRQADCAGAIAECERATPDLVVLDAIAGSIALCAALRERFNPSPGVLMLTESVDDLDAVMSPDAGADDCVVKPCRPAEVVARLRALARRLPKASDRAEVVERGRLRIDTRAHQVSVDGRALALTATEYALLLTLARDAGRVFSRAELLEHIWRGAHAGYARNVDCHIARLRRKFEQRGFAVLPIAAVYGAGYRYDA